MISSEQIAVAPVTPQNQDRESYTGLLALIAALTMLFAALCSAYIVRRGLSGDWTPLALPKLVWASAAASILGSAILELTRGRATGQRTAAALGLISGLLVVGSWRALSNAGVSAASNAGAAFFLVFGSAYLLCLSGGVFALVRSGSRASHLYWHYVAGLWSLLLTMLEVCE